MILTTPPPFLREAGCDRYDAPMLLAFADALRPRERVRPSEWAAANVSLTDEVSPEKPGPWSNEHFPWTQCAMDLEVDNPDKAGEITQKSAQVGLTVAKLVRRACKCANDPGPFLYLINVDKQATHFVSETWGPIVDSVPALKRVFDIGSERRREVMLERPFPGGRLDFAGAGSPGGVSSRTYREIDIDEYDQVEDLFPAHYGGVYPFVQGRFLGLRGRTWFSAWSHPTREGVGIHRLWRDLSDQGRWVFDCPHCAAAVAPRWNCVRYKRTLNDEGAPDPESAVFECPSCRAEISDAQRQRAVWPASMRAGGSGRRESALPPEQAARREYVGLAVHGLCNPYRTVVWFARQYLGCPNEKDRQSFVNVMLGEEYSPTAGQALDPEQVRQMIANRAPAALPGGRRGVQMVCAGSDVQAPRMNPLIYTAVIAFGAHGHDYITGLHRTAGFAAWQELLAGSSVGLDDGRVLGVRAAGIDDAFESGQVKDACRYGQVYAHASSARVGLVPIRFVASSTLNKDNPYVLRAPAKRTHPNRPELGPIDMYDLHRHSWVERALLKVGLLGGGRTLHVACDLPPDFEAQITSQLLTPKRTQHSNWQETEMEWDKAKDRRDDWLMAIVYAYAVAAVRCGLDRIHLIGQEDAPGNEGKAKVLAPAWGKKSY